MKSNHTWLVFWQRYKHGRVASVTTPSAYWGVKYKACVENPACIIYRAFVRAVLWLAAAHAEEIFQRVFGIAVPRQRVKWRSRLNEWMHRSISCVYTRLVCWLLRGKQLHCLYRSTFVANSAVTAATKNFIFFIYIFMKILHFAIDGYFGLRKFCIWVYTLHSIWD